MRPDAHPILVRPLRGDLTPSLIQSLAERRARDELKLFAAEGLRFSMAAKAAQVPFCGLAICKPLLSPAPRIFVREATQARVPLLAIEREPFLAISQMKESSGLIGVFPSWQDPLPTSIRKNDCWLGIESIRTPGNLGTILRCGEAVGATGLLIFGPHNAGPDPFDPGVVRASMGSIFGYRIIRTHHAEFRKWPRRSELRVFGATPTNAVDYRAVTYRRPVVLMLGDERSGLSEAQIATCDNFIRIPMKGCLDSLNVAMATAVWLYEVHNQRHPIASRRRSS